MYMYAGGAPCEGWISDASEEKPSSPRKFTVDLDTMMEMEIEMEMEMERGE